MFKVHWRAPHKTIYLSGQNISIGSFHSLFHNVSIYTGEDPGFPVGGGADPPSGGRQHTILSNFPKNCMKSRKFWTIGEGARHWYIRQMTTKASVNMVKPCKYVMMVIEWKQIYTNLLITVWMIINNETDFHKSVGYIRNSALMYLIWVT